jgi:hypothetical protein
MAKRRQPYNRPPLTPRSASVADNGEPAEGAYGDQPEIRRLEMQRGVSQLLFNYLPGRTVDWEDGLAVVQLGSVRLSAVWEDNRTTTLLEEIAQLLDHWREADGTVDPQFPDPRRERGRFAVGPPAAIEATVFDTSLLCQRCSRLYFPKRRELSRNDADATPMTCPKCGTRTLRQFGFVFVHGCGEMMPITEWIPAMRQTDDGSFEPTHHPARCQRCGDKGQPSLPSRSERVKDMKIFCLTCNTTIIDRLTARCGRCLRQINAQRRRTSGSESTVAPSEEADRPTDTLVTRVAMRVSRYNASDTYYPQTLTMLRLDRPAHISAGDPELELLRRMLPADQRPHSEQTVGDTIAVLAKRLQAAESAGRQGEVANLRLLIAQAVQAPAESSPRIDMLPNNDLVPSARDLRQAIQESIAFRETVHTRQALQIACAGGGATALLDERIKEAIRNLGLQEVLIVDDLPVISATYGYTRRSFEPTYQELSSSSLPTQIRVFPSLDRVAVQRLGRPDLFGAVPILAREGEHQGLFLSLDSQRVLKWLEANRVILPQSEDPSIVRILHALEPIDPYYDRIWGCHARRMVFGLLHSLSHVAMRAATRYAGVERTSISEYLFLPLLGAVIFDNSSLFQLGGLETLARDHLAAFLETLTDESMICLYDTECIDHRGACHGCIHAPEISCRVFNHGLSRAFLTGGHAPWADIASEERIIGYWEIGEGAA